MPKKKTTKKKTKSTGDDSIRPNDYISKIIELLPILVPVIGLAFFIGMIKVELDAVRQFGGIINKLDVNVDFLEYRIQTLESQLAQYRSQTENYIDIPLDRGWEPRGSPKSIIGSEYISGRQKLRVNLRGAKDYAELFVDLTGIQPFGLPQNSTYSYNLASRRLIALVQSERDFQGDPIHKNYVQFILKDENKNDSPGPRVLARNAMKSPTGMEVVYDVPDDEITRNVKEISIRFTINSESNTTYEGSFFVKSIKITR